MTEILICNKCEREAHKMELENKTCDFRLFNGRHCDGTLIRQEVEEEKDEPHLICDTCGRRADLMTLEGHACSWRLPSGKSCTGRLLKAE
jgi:hypothetical protein